METLLVPPLGAAAGHHAEVRTEFPLAAAGAEPELAAAAVRGPRVRRGAAGPAAAARPGRGAAVLAGGQHGH